MPRLPKVLPVEKRLSELERRVNGLEGILRQILAEKTDPDFFARHRQRIEGMAVSSEGSREPSVNGQQ